MVYALAYTRGRGGGVNIGQDQSRVFVRGHDALSGIIAAFDEWQSLAPKAHLCALGANDCVFHDLP